VASDYRRRPDLRRGGGYSRLGGPRAASRLLAPAAQGTINESGPYYGFWSGFGSDLEEFGILGGIAAGVYQLVKKHNCHEPGCWRVGQYPAADGQFMLCYRHHPDYRGRKPTHELIERLHREHLERQAAIHGKLHEAHNHRTSGRAAAHDPSSDVRHGATRPSATTSPDLGSELRHDDWRVRSPSVMAVALAS